MKTYVLFLLLSVGFPNTNQAQGQVVNHQAVGDLAASRQLPCIPMTGVKNTYTPPELLTGFARCVDEGNYDLAARLYLTVRAYTRFDVDRVADQTVSDVNSVMALQMATYMSEAQRKQFDTTFHAIKDDAKAWKEFCTQIHRLGPPQYYPEYLIAHGMGASFGSGSPDETLKAGFDRDRAWRDIETRSLACTL